jgi:hypothetical protein
MNRRAHPHQPIIVCYDDTSSIGSHHSRSITVDLPKFRVILVM